MLLRTLAPAPFLGLGRELGRELDRLALADARHFPSDSWVPAVDVHETPTALVFSVELPGVAKEQVEVSHREGVLTIAGKKESSRVADDAKGVRLEERSYGSFQRAFRLPSDADSARIEAAHANGVLTVTVPRKEAPAPARIEIK